MQFIQRLLWIYIYFCIFYLQSNRQIFFFQILIYDSYTFISITYNLKVQQYNIMQYKYAIQQEMGVFITPLVVCEFDIPSNYAIGGFH